MKFEDYIWWFLILFMFHDFEEVIYMKAWFSQKQDKIAKKFPKYAPALVQHFNQVSQAGFSFAVAIIYILVSAITITASAFHFYLIWLGCFIIYVAHLFIHCIQAIVLKDYVPAVVTSIICIPISCWILHSVLSGTSYSGIVLAIAVILSGAVVIGGVVGLHKLIEHFPY
ncbi:MAG TPA: HXXEE domain-containing protein [Oscillospiraceae bacterium]|nr:HXXEE domain-containing protein [Oscillospiraceae bacterium]